ncbi:epoxide hydrolase family protein [Yinghuangia sp. YIM S09857]|uniref:epoxide hydrolase family protein n=1 Tax=Yinghuangia sp. YIM S09857 TaxID=3436929 RepID=UPI003F52A32C
MTADATAVKPFRIDIPQAELDYLHARLDNARWPHELPDAGWDYGLPLARVQQLAHYWRHGYDWRTHEAEFNSHPQFTTEIDGQRVHFLHVRAANPDAFPLILTHGWPGSVVEFLDVIAPLSEDFHLVIPSIPGWGFSGPTNERGWDIDRVARAWAELMRRLGYTRYGAQGGDFGAAISRALSEHDAEHVAAIHLNYHPTPAPPGEDYELSASDQERLDRIRDYLANQPGARVLNATKPQTIAYGLNDSPIGQLAWILDMMTEWAGDDFAISDDRVLTNVMLYWLTGTAGSAPRLHHDSGPARWKTTQPVAIASFPEDITRPIRQFAEKTFDIAQWSEFDRGGHFPGLEAPDLLAADIRKFFLSIA